MKFQVGDKVGWLSRNGAGGPMTVTEVATRHLRTSDGKKWTLRGDEWGASSYSWTRIEPWDKVEVTVQEIRRKNAIRSVRTDIISATNDCEDLDTLRKVRAIFDADQQPGSEA